MWKPDEERGEQTGIQGPFYEDFGGTGRRQSSEREAGIGVNSAETHGRERASERGGGVHRAEEQVSERPQRRSAGGFLILMILFFHVVYLYWNVLLVYLIN